MKSVGMGGAGSGGLWKKVICKGGSDGGFGVVGSVGGMRVVSGCINGADVIAGLCSMKLWRLVTL